MECKWAILLCFSLCLVYVNKRLVIISQAKESKKKRRLLEMFYKFRTFLYFESILVLNLFSSITY
ncbi:hypothetical protein F4703DRAFT_1846437 [Phycomyces blakesleeanus]